MNKISEVSSKVLGTKTIKIDDIIEQYDGVVTINGLSYANYKGDRVPVFTFVEGEGTAFWGGCKTLRELAQSLEEVFDGDLSAINEAFRHTGVRIKIEPIVKTAGGNPFRPVSKLGDVQFEFVNEIDDSDEPDFNPETGEVTDSGIGEITNVYVNDPIVDDPF